MSLIEDRWLSGQIGKPVFRLDGEPPDILPRGFIYTKLPAHDLAVLQRLQRLGFSLVDTALTFEAPIPLPGADANPRPPGVRMARPDDREAVLKIAREGFSYDRFHSDPEIPDHLADSIKEAWVENYFRGERGDWLVLFEGEGGPAGFLLLLKRDDQLVIDLIAVAKESRGTGIGRSLITYEAAALKPFQTMLVGTQATNTPSVRLYESLGFRLIGAQHILHCHR